MIGLSFVVVTGYAGQVSLAQLALAGAGAYTLSFLTASWGIPFPIAPLVAALVRHGDRRGRSGSRPSGCGASRSAW